MAEASQETGRDTEAGRLDSVRSRSQRTWQEIQAAWARAQAIQAGPPEATTAGSREPLTTPRYARMQAQLASMPVIEQAKGVLMARRGCDAEQASDLLWQAAERSNVTLAELAEQIVAKARQRQGLN